MSKKMKAVAFDPSPHGAYVVEAKARFKHQSLVQDYRELQKEAESMRKKLKNMKQRKLTLLSEVRFLQRRYNYLRNKKAAKTPLERVTVQSKKIEIKLKNTVKVKSCSRKKANPRNLPPVFDLNHKGRIFCAKESAFRNPSQILDLNQKDWIHRGKEATLRNAMPLFDMPTLDLNQNGSLYSGKEIAPENSGPAFNLNQTERTCIGRENDVKSQAPIFDLNQISGEEELPDNYEALRLEEPKKIVSRCETDEHHNDSKLSGCRNVENIPNRAGKRKISWQDPVALKV